MTPGVIPGMYVGINLHNSQKKMILNFFKIFLTTKNAAGRL